MYRYKEGRGYRVCNTTMWLGQTTFPRIPSPARTDPAREATGEILVQPQSRGGATDHTYYRSSPGPPDCHVATTNTTLYNLGASTSFPDSWTNCVSLSHYGRDQAAATEMPPSTWKQQTHSGSACPRGLQPAGGSVSHLFSPRSHFLPPLPPACGCQLHIRCNTAFQRLAESSLSWIGPNPCDKSLHFIHTTHKHTNLCMSQWV